MRSLAIGFAILVLTSFAAAQSSIHEVDFKNFTYPLSGPLLGHGSLVWLGKSASAHRKQPIHLVHGKDLTKESSFKMDGKEYAQYEGFSLQSVSFADFTGDDRDDAIVVLRYYTGGTQTTNYVYFYTFEHGKPVLLAYCHTGDRAYEGLNAVYGDHGALVFELFDPDKRQGDCCSSGLIVRRFKWRSGYFQPFGAVERRSLKEK